MIPRLYLAFMVQISIAPWKDLYDETTNDIVQSTGNTTLNGKFYAKIMAALEGQALQNMVSRKHIHGNGLLLVREWQQMYKQNNVPEVIAAKTGEFWSQTKHLPH
jgi:hypothetical protein